MKKIIIIGKNSFIGNSLYTYLKKKYLIEVLSFEKFLSLKNQKLASVDWIINCTINKDYIEKKYKKSNDFDVIIANKISNLNCKLIFLSSRKIYEIADNIREKGKKYPKCNYSKNKLKSEKNLGKILDKRLLILRISNLIGLKNKKSSKRKTHETFIDYFFKNIKKGLIFDNKKIYKDFLSTDQFSFIIEKLINKNITGIYNISIGKKVYLKNLIEWLNYYNRGNYMLQDLPKNYINGSFYLNNSKLIRKIKIDLKIKDLEKDCKKLSKIFFKK